MGVWAVLGMARSQVPHPHHFPTPGSHSFTGYQTRGCSQPARVKFTLKMLVTMAPIVLILLGLLLFKLYPIDEENRRQNKKALQALR